MGQNVQSLTVTWGLNGLRKTQGCGACVIVDVLSFSTAVVAGCSNGAIIFPYRWQGQGVEEFASSVGATVAARREQRPGGDLPSLSPPSLSTLPPGYRLVLPSPNGSSLAAESEADVVLLACLRNASAVADYLNAQEADVVVVAAGETWPDGSLRVALEDLIGAGAVVAGWLGRTSIEARAAQAVFEHFAGDLETALRSTASGQELIDRGFEEDVVFASHLGASNVIPRLRDGAFSAQHGG